MSVLQSVVADVGLTLVFIGDVVLSLSVDQQRGQDERLVQLALQINVVVAWREGGRKEIHDYSPLVLERIMDSNTECRNTGHPLCNNKTFLWKSKKEKYLVIHYATI